MNGKWEGATKIIHARKILNEAISSLEGVPNVELALRVYGHQSPITATYQDCNDTKLEVPFGANNHAQIKSFITYVVPKGTTPIAQSLAAAETDFPDRAARNVIILITDGQEACDQFPCEVAKKLKDKGIIVTPFVVGLGIDLKYLNDFECIGRFYEASTMVSFEKVMKSVVNDALLNTTAQINLFTVTKEPKETNVTIFMYEAGTQNLKYTFTHTLNYRGNPDTLAILNPDLKYDMVVNTLPQVVVRNISILRNQHNIIPADCPQGMLVTRIKGPTKLTNVKVRVSQKGQSITLNVQEINQIQNYLVGTYDLEILTLPRIYKKDVVISQSAYSYIDIPGSGMLKYSATKPIVGQIFVNSPEGKNAWVCDVGFEKLTDIIYLQPGQYKVVYRLKSAVSTDYTMVQEFKVTAGENTFINL